MWIISYKKYACSKFATFVSVVGALARYSGVLCLISEALLAGVITIAVGIGGHFLAEEINKKVLNKTRGVKL